MYQVLKNGTVFELLLDPVWVKMQDNGSYCLCQKSEAEGVVMNGTVFPLENGSVSSLDNGSGQKSSMTVTLQETDGGAFLRQLETMNQQLRSAARLYVQTVSVNDDQAKAMPDVFITWEEALAAGKPVEENSIINDGGTLYRVVASGGVTPQEHQPPHMEGMLAVYRPINFSNTGSQSDPIPYTSGMDVEKDKYYSYNGGLYLCNLDMKPCVWDPGTEGLWQWSKVE